MMRIAVDREQAATARMARYFFDNFNGNETVVDIEGQDCPDLTEVRSVAVDDVRELIAGVVARREVIGQRELRVRDSAGDAVLTIQFRDVLDRR